MCEVVTKSRLSFMYKMIREIISMPSADSGYPIDLIVTRPLIAHLSLYTRLKPTCDKKIGIMGLAYIFNQ